MGLVLFFLGGVAFYNMFYFAGICCAFFVAFNMCAHFLVGSLHLFVFGYLFGGFMDSQL